MYTVIIEQLGRTPSLVKPKDDTPEAVCKLLEELSHQKTILSTSVHVTGPGGDVLVYTAESFLALCASDEAGEVSETTVLPPTTRPRAMVLVPDKVAGRNSWMDLEHRCRSMSSLTKRLNKGLKEGDWTSWRIITIHSHSSL